MKWNLRISPADNCGVDIKHNLQQHSLCFGRFGSGKFRIMYTSVCFDTSRILEFFNCFCFHLLLCRYKKNTKKHILVQRFQLLRLYLFTLFNKLMDVQVFLLCVQDWPRTMYFLMKLQKRSNDFNLLNKKTC